MKAEFLTDLDVNLKAGSDSVWVLQSPLKYYSEILKQTITIPTCYEMEGEEPPQFETDFASVPRLPIFYTMWGDRAHREAVLHDYLYRKDSIPVVSRSVANKLFLEAMDSTGKSWCVRWPMYLGVCLGGGISYHKKKVRDKI